MRALYRMVAFGLALGVAGVSIAEEEGASERAKPKIQKIQEVEHGFWVRSAFGFSMALQNVFTDKSLKTPLWPPGPLLGVELGYDFGQVASMHLAILGKDVSGSKPTGTGRADVSNDIGALMCLVGARFNVMTTKRLGWFLKAGAGYMLTVPSISGFSDGVIVQGGTGLEYATNLRHFFVGIEAGAEFIVASSAVSVYLTPILKYTF